MGWFIVYIEELQVKFSFNIDLLSLKIVLAAANNVDPDQMQLQVKFSFNFDFLSLKIVLASANNVDPDQMLHYVIFHLGIHCLPKYQSMGFPVTKGLITNHQLLVSIFKTNYIFQEEIGLIFQESFNLHSFNAAESHTLEVF